MSSHAIQTPEIDLKAIEANLRPLSIEKLKFRFFECYSGAASFMAEAAMCVKLMKEHGDPLTGMPMVGTFLRIASGQILPELVWKFIESPNRQRVERLPLEDQKRIANDSMVPAVFPKPGGGYDKRMVDLCKASPEVAKQVAGPDGLRNPEEQLAVLTAPKPKPVVSTLAEPADASEPLTHSVTVKLTVSELSALKINAARAMISDRDMARRGLIRSGVLKEGKA